MVKEGRSRYTRGPVERDWDNTAVLGPFVKVSPGGKLEMISVSKQRTRSERIVVRAAGKPCMCISEHPW